MNSLRFSYFMELGKLKDEFYKWASKRTPFTYNKYTKRLICHGKHFEELVEPLQLSIITSFLDEKKVWIIVNPVDNPEWWTYQILMEDLMAPFYQAYVLPLEDEILTSRFLANQAAINKAIELLNT